MKKKLLLLMSTVLLLCLTSLSVMASGITTSKGASVTTVTPNTTNTKYNYSYTQNDKVEKDTYGIVIPVQINSTGYFEVTGTMNGQNTIKKATFELFTDKDCTTKPSDTLYIHLYDTTLPKTSYCFLDKGMYYLRISSYLYGDNVQLSNSGTVSMRFVSNADRNLAHKTATIISKRTSGTLLKITAPSTGTITVTGTKGTYVSLYNSKKALVSKNYDSLGDKNSNKLTFTVAKGTYYIQTKNNANVYWASYSFAGVPTWKSGKSYTITPADKQYYYAKFKPSKSGYLTLKYSGEYFTYMTLCNSSKKAISQDVYVSHSYGDQKAVFAVKKNTTYYLKIRGEYGYKITVKPTFTAVSEKSGSKISKAVSIKKGKTAKGLILPGDSNKDYYKLVVSKTQKVNVQVTGKAYSGSIKVTFYMDKKMKRSMGTIYVNDSFNKKYNLYTLGSKKLNKGTYYIKVERKDSKTNGYYSIKWLK